ncbi:hypothetical protein [Methylobacterium sp. 88A]|uniref:hypothetical protein n=1 Tax=Methylobacterium sp. 88A TaxID=1131813 RepID=UPI00035E3E86|nr:hypothetical protein [Methylobacterium sp. 88A]
MKKTAETEATPPTFTPFADDATVETIGGLSVENGSGSIAIHGSLDLPRDRMGLDRARKLKAVADAIVAALEASDLPDEAPRAASNSRTVENPFA